MYQQAKFCKDETACSNILSSDNPADAIMYSHKIQNLDKAEWEKVKRGVMENILRLKFRDEKLARELLDTGNKHLHEAERDLLGDRCDPRKPKRMERYDLDWRFSTRPNLMEIRKKI